MDRRQIGLKLTIDALGVPFTLTTFSDRLIIQKAICLAQAGGIQLGYDFRWYLRGPYSPALARDAFAVAAEIAEGDDESSGWKFDEESQALVERIAQMIEPHKSSDRAGKLELLASVHFVVTRRDIPQDDLPQLTETMRTFGKSFSEKDVQAALGDLSKHGLLASTGT